MNNPSCDLCLRAAQKQDLSTRANELPTTAIFSRQNSQSPAALVAPAPKLSDKCLRH